MDAGMAYLIRLCAMEARVTWLWLTAERTPGEWPMPRSFIRGITGAQIIDKWTADGFDYTEDQVGVPA
jgi:hypothetical protein